MDKIQVIIISIAFVLIGISSTQFVTSETQKNNYTLSQFLYTSTPPIVPDDTSEKVCDFFGNNCTWQPVSMDDGLAHFNNWCYSIMNTYTSGITSQTFRTVSIDCFNYVMDQKLEPLNQKIENLTAQIAILNAKLGK